MSLHIQFMTLYLMAGSGVVLGIGFDIIEVLVREFKLRRLATALMDIAYWLIATLFVFQVLVYANDGQVRMFIFIGLFVGVVLYYSIFSSKVRLATTWMLRFILRLIRGIIRILDILLIRPLVYVYRLMKIIVGFLIAFSMFLGGIVIQWFRYVYHFIMRRF